MGLFFTPLDSILSSVGKLRLLRALHAASSPMSGREAAGIAGISVQPAQRALRDLVALGVVRRDDTRSQYLYTLNRENYLVRRSIGPLFEAEQERVDEVFRDLRKAVSRFESGARRRVEGVYLFGSAARGKDVIGSDLDVAAVVAAPQHVNEVHETLAQLAPSLYSLYGLRISALVIDLKKLRAMHADGDALIGQLLRDNRRITGKRLEELIHGDTRKQKGSRPLTG